VTAAEVELGDRRVTVRAKHFILAAGAVNSAALLLQSAAPGHAAGLANRSGMVGRNYMVHNSTFLVGLDPRRRNETSFQKTLGMNDWYLSGPGRPYPLGNLQMLGKLQGQMVKPARRLIPLVLLDLATHHSLDVYLTTEDLPDPENRLTVDGLGRFHIHWQPNNLGPHRRLLQEAKAVLHRAGYPLTFHQRMGIETNSHMCGTAVMGEDPRTSVLDADGRAHDLENLWITDSSGFVSSAAVNPALTIAANALRVIARSGLLGASPSSSSRTLATKP
jgi:choline dehydrogenase-like flavoprotein